MLFVVLSNSKNGTCKERIARRMQWKNPEGTNLIAEYWLTTEFPNVIQIVETDDAQLLLSAVAEWADVFDISIYPAITGEEGMRNAQEMMKNL